MVNPAQFFFGDLGDLREHAVFYNVSAHDKIQLFWHSAFMVFEFLPHQDSQVHLCTLKLMT